ncbi:MAG: aminomethyl-transferring glycine dehydrogenase subunit GcvPB, partial [Gammaproteobacteria bacterium]
MEPLIFQLGRKGRAAGAHLLDEIGEMELPSGVFRDVPPLLPEVSELDVVRHYTRLSQKNFSIDTNFYPLGSCTMKYNPRACNTLAMLPGFRNRHPLAPEVVSQGFMECMFELQEMLKVVT